MKDEKTVVPFGGGVNSVALMIELVKKRIRPDYVIFANTGGWTNLGEKHETYRNEDEIFELDKMPCSCSI